MVSGTKVAVDEIKKWTTFRKGHRKKKEQDKKPPRQNESNR
jgi:hypothetical protein